ncbi:DUF6933 domain-containing protein [Vagococcus elongatus]|uniref:DUF6933 domain-containing protein n=1 Tax=Vagococcus elongatus TaxID=180344 RepID=A0A430AV64_9ENTE|nr:hypothetical protein [Vagococcus elongatus]RSU11950.1 hypothetical protein CBF29_07470 [Vagococcus elongatus]
MIINPTKKTQPLFSALSKVENASLAKLFSQRNPFFSWEANYYNENRKKILVLVNGLTLAPVVLADINAKNKKELAVYIREGIHEVFKQAGVSSQKIKRYFELAGEIQVNKGFDRSLISVTNMFIRMAQGTRIKDPAIVQKELINWLLEVPISTIDYASPQKAILQAFEGELVIHPVSEADIDQQKDKIQHTATQTWKDFSHWKKYESYDWFEGYEKIAEEIIENNQLVLEGFQRYLKDGLGLSDKVVRRHLGNVQFFIDEYLLYYGLHTPITDFYDVGGFLADFFPRKALWASASEIKSSGTALKKFYTFLSVVGVIDQAQLKEVKEIISEGIEVGLDTLEMMDNFEDFF